jgi:hypothetical protein
MSRNGNGVYTLPAGNPVVPGTVIATTWANNTMNDLASAMTDSVAADGQTPMTGPLNMNSNKVTNLATGTISGDGINYAQFNTPTFGGAVVCSSTLAVTGATTLSSTLAVTGDASFNSTGQIKLPNGTTAERSATPALGSVRYNTTLQTFEGYTTYNGQTISSITNVTTIATLTTAANHNLTTGTFITVSGATPAAYNGTFSITVVDAVSFTYTMLTDPAGSATVVGLYKVGVWGQIGGGATGNGGDQVFVENNQTITASYQIPVGRNASTVSPITINAGVAVTVPSGSRWVVL